MCENTGEYTMYIYIIFKSQREDLRINCRIFLCIYMMIFRIYIDIFMRIREDYHFESHHRKGQSVAEKQGD